MKTRVDDTVIDEALHYLDPARMAELTEPERDRGEATFARIVAAPLDETEHVEPVRPYRRRRRLLAALGLAGAAGVSVPGLMLGVGNAYGSWTPTPAPLTDGAAVAAANTCRDALGAPDLGERVALAERRGGWTYIILTGPTTEAFCLMSDERTGEGATAAPEDLFASYGAPIAPPQVDPHRIDETSSVQGNTDEGWFVGVEGFVGDEVTGVTVHISSGPDLEASIAGNRFAAWWPTSEPSSTHPSETWSYTVHLADGSSWRTAG